MEDLSLSLFTQLQDKYDNKDRLVHLPSELIIDSKKNKAKINSLESLSDPLAFQQFFQDKKYKTIDSKFMTSLLEKYNIPVSHDIEFVDYLVSQNNLKFWEKYCMKNMNEETVMTVIKEVLNSSNDSAFEKFSLEEKSNLMFSGKGHQKLNFCYHIFSKKIDKHQLMKVLRENIEAKLTLDIFYIILVLLKLSSDNSETIDNLLEWLGVMIDSLMFCFIKKDINRKNFTDMKSDLEAALAYLEETHGYSKAVISLCDNINNLHSHSLKYFITQSNDDLLIEKLMI